MLQTILIPKAVFSLQESNRWIKNNGYKLKYYGKPVHITEHYYRYRQRKPNPDKYYRTVKLTNGILLVHQ